MWQCGTLILACALIFDCDFVHLTSLTLFKGSHLNVSKKINSSVIYNDNTESSLKLKLFVNQLLSDKKRLLEQPRIEKCDSLSEAEWIEDLKLAKVTKVTKNLTKNFSHTLNKIMYLYPEECLCLLEMKCLILKWNERKLSIKNAFSLLLAPGSGCTFEQFRTYGYLVKLGFRVFKHDNKLKNNTYNSKDLTKLQSLFISKSAKRRALKKAYKAKNNLQLENNVPPPAPSKLKFTNKIILTPKSCYLPHNLQPYYDVYSFDLCVIDGSSKITNYSSFKEQTDSRIKRSISQPIEMYPVYEKNIPQTIKFDEENIYEPRHKRLKLTETDKDNSHNIQNKIVYSSMNDNNFITLDSSTNLACEDLKSNKTIENGTEINSPVILNNGSNACAFNNKINDSHELLDIRNIKVEFDADSAENVNLSEADRVLPESLSFYSIPKDQQLNMHLNVPYIQNIKVEFEADSAENLNLSEADRVLPESLSSDSILENKQHNMHLNVPNIQNIKVEFEADTAENVNLCEADRVLPESLLSLYSIPEDKQFNMNFNASCHIRQKLLAIKPSTVHKEFTKNTNNKHYTMHYDVYYPNNPVPKTSRPAPDFRVIVFEDDFEHFPKIHDINVSNPNDNIPTLWAIVNSSSVSFFSVDNIIMPKTTDWNKKSN